MGLASCLDPEEYFPWRFATSFSTVHSAHRCTHAHTKKHTHMQTYTKAHVHMERAKTHYLATITHNLLLQCGTVAAANFLSCVCTFSG